MKKGIGGDVVKMPIRIRDYLIINMHPMVSKSWMNLRAAT